LFWFVCLLFYFVCLFVWFVSFVCHLFVLFVWFVLFVLFLCLFVCLFCLFVLFVCLFGLFCLFVCLLWFVCLCLVSSFALFVVALFAYFVCCLFVFVCLLCFCLFVFVCCLFVCFFVCLFVLLLFGCLLFIASLLFVLLFCLFVCFVCFSLFVFHFSLFVMFCLVVCVVYVVCFRFVGSFVRFAGLRCLFVCLPGSRLCCSGWLCAVIVAHFHATIAGLAASFHLSPAHVGSGSCFNYAAQCLALARPGARLWLRLSARLPCRLVTPSGSYLRPPGLASLASARRVILRVVWLTSACARAHYARAAIHACVIASCQLDCAALRRCCRAVVSALGCAASVCVACLRYAVLRAVLLGFVRCSYLVRASPGGKRTSSTTWARG
jgi:hypothetical protein